MKRPSSEPLPLVFAVAITLKPVLGLTKRLIFFDINTFTLKNGCKHMILFDARSTSSKKIAPSILCLNDRTILNPYSPIHYYQYVVTEKIIFISLNSDVDTEQFTFGFCTSSSSTRKVLLPDKPVMKPV